VSNASGRRSIYALQARRLVEGGEPKPTR
jgi:hypothetical protein